MKLSYRKYLPLKVLGFLWLLAVAIGFISGYIFKFVPFEQERMLGDALFGALFDDKDLLSEESIYLQERADKIATLIDIESGIVQVHYIEDDEFNAYTLPGGYIVVFSSIFDEIRDQPEVIDMLLAHEIAHVKYRHVVQHMGSGIVSLLTGMSGLLNLETLRYSRMQEKKADLLAVDVVYQLHGRLDGAYKLMYMLQRHTRDSVEFLSTHPDMDKRIEYIRSYANEHAIKVY